MPGFATFAQAGNDGSMRTIAQHQQAVRDVLAPLADRDPLVMTMFTASALVQFRDYHRVLALPAVSPISLPPFDNSQMDGFAVRVADIVPGMALRVAAPIAAGAGIRVHEPRSATPIMTGAPVPRGADAVIPIESATPARFPAAGTVSTVSFDSVPMPGAFIRVAGSDLVAGTEVVPAGATLGPAQWGIVAATGVTELSFVRPVNVLVVSTGDELRDPGDELEPGQIYDANGMALAIALAECHATVESVEVVRDDVESARAMLADHAPWADLIVTTGGVSAGAYEVVRDLFVDAGVDFEAVAMQPGGPQGLGMARLSVEGVPLDRPLIAFPGNPVSTLVSFDMFLRPVLRELHGLPPHRPSHRARLVEDLDSPGAKHQVRRGVLTPDGQVELVGGPSSHLLLSYASSTVLVHIPVGVSHLDAGELVEVWSIVD